MIDNRCIGKFIAFDGPNGVGKTTLINAVHSKLIKLNHMVIITKEPTATELGEYVRYFAEQIGGNTLACLVAADRYEHLKHLIIPALQEGKIVLIDRYILSSLILQQMDGVEKKFIMEVNNDIVKPDLQIALKAQERVIQKRLNERDSLTRFERGERTLEELKYMRIGEDILRKENIKILEIDNSENLENNVDNIVTSILNLTEAI